MDLIGVLTVVGSLVIIDHIMAGRSLRSWIPGSLNNLIGNYIPTMADKRLNDGGQTLIPDILGQTHEGTI